MKTQLFGILNLKNDGILNFAINKEKRAKKLVVCIFQEIRRSLKQVGTRYGLRKVHEDIINNCPSF